MKNDSHFTPASFLFGRRLVWRKTENGMNTMCASFFSLFQCWRSNHFMKWLIQRTIFSSDSYLRHCSHKNSDSLFSLTSIHNPHFYYLFIVLISLCFPFSSFCFIHFTSIHLTSTQRAWGCFVFNWFLIGSMVCGFFQSSGLSSF